MRSERRRRLFILPEEAERARLGTFNLGLYNVIWGMGAFVGALLLGGADAAAGQSVLLIICVAHLGLGLLMFLSERRLWDLPSPRASCRSPSPSCCWSSCCPPLRRQSKDGTVTSETSRGLVRGNPGY